MKSICFQPEHFFSGDTPLEFRERVWRREDFTVACMSLGQEVTLSPGDFLVIEDDGSLHVWTAGAFRAAFKNRISAV